MQFDISFNVNASCIKFIKTDNGQLQWENKESEKEKSRRTLIDLEISDKEAPYFLFKFAPDVFAIKGYHVVMKHDKLESGVETIMLFPDDDQDHVYLVSNIEQLLASINEGYFRIKMMQKLSSILEYDFETSLQGEDGVVDEFDLNS